MRRTRIETRTFILNSFKLVTSTVSYQGRILLPAPQSPLWLQLHPKAVADSNGPKILHRIWDCSKLRLRRRCRRLRLVDGRCRLMTRRMKLLYNLERSWFKPSSPRQMLFSSHLVDSDWFWRWRRRCYSSPGPKGNSAEGSSAPRPLAAFEIGRPVAWKHGHMGKDVLPTFFVDHPLPAMARRGRRLLLFVLGLSLIVRWRPLLTAASRWTAML